MFTQRFTWVVAMLVAGMWAQAATAQCRGGNRSMGARMSQTGPMGQMGSMGPMNAFQMMNSGQMQGQGGGMCMGQGGGMNSGMGNLSATPAGFSSGIRSQMPNDIYAQMLPSGTATQNSSSLGLRRGQTLQRSVLATFDTNDNGKLEGAEFKAAQLAASQRRQQRRGK